jgi:ethanolamine ammonia-lyase large subunit
MNPARLRQLLVLANRPKEGDLVVGGTTDEQVAAEARTSLALLTLAEIDRSPLVDDGVSEFLARAIDRSRAAETSMMTVGQLKQALLGGNAAGWTLRYREGLSSEAIAAVVKLMTDNELAQVSNTIFNPLGNQPTSIGSAAHFGSRIQPNSPGDDPEEILMSILVGLSYGCGDVILGLNPASDDVDSIVRLELLLKTVVDRLQLPTRYCVLSDIIKQTSARQRAPVPVGFQSLAGTSAALNGMVGLDAEGITDLARGFDGLYFETGQGSEVTNAAAEGVDMVTLESRTYGVARAIRNSATAETGNRKWLIVNDVAGFIGPEVFRSPDQLMRACLEDIVMAKLHGLTMGLDVCATFHMGIDPPTLRRLTVDAVTRAAPAYLMAVAGNADPMLGYMTTAFREHPALRRGPAGSAKRIAPEMHGRLRQLELMKESGEMAQGNDAGKLYALYLKAGGESRSFETLRSEGAHKISVLEERGFDLGLGDAFDSGKRADDRIQAIYDHARRALYASLDESVIRDVSPSRITVATCARDREDYLANARAGERISDRDAIRLSSLYGARRPRVQLLISDGLNANAANENVRELLPALIRRLTDHNCELGQVVVVIRNGRLRAGYHAGALLGVDVVIHLIGERPGTGLNLLSAYITYGRDVEGRMRWAVDLDHSNTTAICGINQRGKPPIVAAEEIGNAVRRILHERRSGVELGKA